jgi:hypothetical protein
MLKNLPDHLTVRVAYLLMGRHVRKVVLRVAD